MLVRKNKFYSTIAPFCGMVFAVCIMGQIGQLKAVDITQNEYAMILQSKNNSIDEIKALFPASAQEIQERAAWLMQTVGMQLLQVYLMPDDQRTFANTVGAMDELRRQVSMHGSAIHLLTMVSPDQELRNAAHEAIVSINQFELEQFHNPKAYHAVKSLIHTRSVTREGLIEEDLTPEQVYYMQEEMRSFKKEGYELPEEEFEQVRALRQELSVLEIQFEDEINKGGFVLVNINDITGVSSDFLSTLTADDNGQVTLNCDYPTYFEIMKHCTNANVRQALYLAFNNRAYPANMDTLATIIQKRDQLANLLCYASYADYDIDDEMAKNTENVEAFLAELVVRAQVKAKSELTELMQNVPASVVLSDDGKLQPWDIFFVQEAYKQTHFNVDERSIAEYFPVDKAIAGVFAIYQQFLNLDFELHQLDGMWSNDLSYIVVKDKGSATVRGTIILDLFPRADKFSHACCAGIIPAQYTLDDQGNKMICPAACIVIANLSKPVGDKPALLKYDEVNTFFHEFGHAMHNVLGNTMLAAFSGTHVKRDFVEMPSQMFEEWLSVPAILKNITSHYVTGEPMSDDFITKVTELEHFDAGYSAMRQACFAFLSLNLFKEGQSKNIDGMVQSLSEQFFPQIRFEPQGHTAASFGHLMGYGAKYYGYMWSKVFALDLFSQIKQQGLLDGTVGARFVDTILGKGGSADPEELLFNFLGRAPEQSSFFQSLGLVCVDNEPVSGGDSL